MSSAREAISAAYNAFEDTFYRGDATALCQIYTDDAALLVPGAPPIKGRAAITGAWQGLLGAGGNTVRVDVSEVQEMGEWAYDIGAFTTTAPDGTVVSKGNYLVVWRQQANGDWKIHRDIFN